MERRGRRPQAAHGESGPDGHTGRRRVPSALVVAPDGRFLWTATRGADVLSLFALDPTGERPTLHGTVPCGGNWPRDLVLDPSGRFLYAANERSGDVTWFTVDRESGVPVRGGSAPVPAASCVVFG